MAESPRVEYPWIAIPRFAKPGQPHAFANRENQLAQLYKAVIAAGNAVRQGESSVRTRYVVTGYMGTGKSALILQALGMLRDEIGIAEGQQVAVPPDLPEPLDRERWLILRASGKQVAGIGAIADELRKSVLSVLDDVQEEALRKAPEALKAKGILEIPLLHRLLRPREAKLFSEVRSALTTLVKTIEYVRRWEGSVQRDKLESATRLDTTHSVDVQAQLKAAGIEPKTSDEQAALKIAASYIRESAATSTLTSSVERQIVVDANLVVQSLNAFFLATDRAGLPTILVLDDFDEFASNIGPSYAGRAKVLASILGPFSRLAPTCFIIGLREEYWHEDVLRQFDVIHVPPMTRATAAQAIGAWARRQEPPLSAEVTQALSAMGDRFLQRFGQDEPVVIPFRFLQLVAWAANHRLAQGESDEEILTRYLSSTFSSVICRAVHHVARAMPEEDIRPCAEAVPVDPGPYALTRRDRESLEKAGLLRPFMAGDPTDESVVLDPLCAYLRASFADKRVAPPTREPAR